MNIFYNKKIFGNLFMIIAPSGTGKTTLVNNLISRDPKLRLSISFTTRFPRIGEINNIHYKFVSFKKFMFLYYLGEFLEITKIYGNYYGTSYSWVYRKLSLGYDILLEIDWKGAMQISRIFKNAIKIFIFPPTLNVLKDRLYKRGKDSLDSINTRLSLAKYEMSFSKYADYILINDDFNNTFNKLQNLILTNRLYNKNER